MKRGKSAHREADNVGFVDLQRIEYRADIVTRALLRIFFLILRHIRRRIATRIEGDAAIMLRKMADLLLPGANVASKFMNEYDRYAFARILLIEFHSIVSRSIRPGLPIDNAVRLM